MRSYSELGTEYKGAGVYSPVRTRQVTKLRFWLDCPYLPGCCLYDIIIHSPGTDYGAWCPWLYTTGVTYFLTNYHKCNYYCLLSYLFTCSVNPYACGFCKLSCSDQWNVTVVFATLSLKNLGFRGKWQHLLPVFRFGSIEWAFVSRRNGFYRCRHEWLCNTRATLTKVIALNVFAAEEYIRV